MVLTSDMMILLFFLFFVSIGIGYWLKDMNAETIIINERFSIRIFIVCGKLSIIHSIFISKHLICFFYLFFCCCYDSNRRSALFKFSITRCAFYFQWSENCTLKWCANAYSSWCFDHYNPLEQIWTKMNEASGSIQSK